MKRKIQTGKKFGKLVAAAMAAAFVFMSATTASAGEAAAKVESSTIGDLVDILDGEGGSEPVGTPVMMEDGTVMYRCNIKDLDTGRTQTVYDLAQGDASTQAVDTIYHFDWICNPDKRHVSGDYKMTKGQGISGAVNVTLTEKKFLFGFMDDEGTAWYVERNGCAAFNYVIPATDWYRVFVQNNYKSTTLHAMGSFEYYDRK